MVIELNGLIYFKDYDAPYRARSELYDSLLEFFPDSMREPKGNLLDLVPLS